MSLGNLHFGREIFSPDEVKAYMDEEAFLGWKGN